MERACHSGELARFSQVVGALVKPTDPVAATACDRGSSRTPSGWPRALTRLPSLGCVNVRRIVPWGGVVSATYLLVGDNVVKRPVECRNFKKIPSARGTCVGRRGLLGETVRTECVAIDARRGRSVKHPQTDRAHTSILRRQDDRRRHRHRTP